MNNDFFIPENGRKHFDKADVVAGYAFLGGWVGFLLGTFDLTSPDISGHVSLVLAAVGGIAGLILAKNK